MISVRGGAAKIDIAGHDGVEFFQGAEGLMVIRQRIQGVVAKGEKNFSG